MPHIAFAVTQKVLDQVADGHDYQRQLAIRDASIDLRTSIDQASRQNRVRIAVSGEFVLSVGDNGAIWGTHQQTPQEERDFADLYALLSRRPGTAVTFRW